MGIRQLALRFRRRRRRSGAGSDRRAGPLLHAAFRRGDRARQERGLHLHDRFGQRHGDRHRRGCVRFIRAATPARRARTWPTIFPPRPNYVMAPHSGRARAQGLVAVAGRHGGSTSRTGPDDTISVIDTAARSVTRHHRAGRPPRLDARAARRAALLQRAVRVPGPLRLRQLPPRSDLRRPVHGTWSRTASARTSSTTACSRTWPRRRRSNGTAGIRTWKPSAARAPKSSSIVRKATTARN